MNMAIGYSWLHHRKKYQARFHGPVPEWVCCFPTAKRIQLLRVALNLGWRLPEMFLIRDEILR